MSYKIRKLMLNIHRFLVQVSGWWFLAEVFQCFFFYCLYVFYFCWLHEFQHFKIVFDVVCFWQFETCIYTCQCACRFISVDNQNLCLHDKIKLIFAFNVCFNCVCFNCVVNWSWVLMDQSFVLWFYCLKLCTEFLQVLPDFCKVECILSLFLCFSNFIVVRVI